LFSNFELEQANPQTKHKITSFIGCPAFRPFTFAILTVYQRIAKIMYRTYREFSRRIRIYIIQYMRRL